MKDRFSAIDIRAIVSNFQKYIGTRVDNVYDLSPKTYLLKVKQPGKDKQLILIDSAMRIHSTKYTRETPKIPSIFTLKLRKHINNKLITSIQQLGIDRVIDITFSTGEAAFHLIIEFYSKGNIILTDYNYNILTLLRTFLDKHTNNLIATNHIYPIAGAQKFSPIPKEQLRTNLASVAPSSTLKQALPKFYEFSAPFVEHCILEAGLDPKNKVSSLDDEKLDKLFEQLQKAEEFVVRAAQTQVKGWIVLRTNKADAASEAAAATETTATVTPEVSPLVVYDAFVPLLYHQYTSRETKEFDTFDEAVDEFFSKIESQKIDLQKVAKESTVSKKLGKVQKDQMQRVQSLERKQAECERKAQLIQDNLADVEKAILIIRSAIANSIDWSELGRIVKEEQKNGDPIAHIIHKLQLDTNHITLLLSHACDDDDEGLISLKPDLVDVDVSLSAYANRQRYYEMRRAAEEKKEKTHAAAAKAMKAAEKKATRDMKEVRVKNTLQKQRKQLWFEKFYWFISSDNYIIISGRDAQQNELIVKRYMQRGDLYIHADIHGASTCVIKNPSGQPVPFTTLEEAGSMAICRSAAWDAKIVTSAYWVYHHQVSKTAPTGEYLSTGSFMIRGKKNFLPPSPLLMAFGFVFRLDESCVAKHLGERSHSKLTHDEGASAPAADAAAAAADVDDSDATTDVNNESASTDHHLHDASHTSNEELASESNNQPNSGDNQEKESTKHSDAPEQSITTTNATADAADDTDDDDADEVKEVASEEPPVATKEEVSSSSSSNDNLTASTGSAGNTSQKAESNKEKVAFQPALLGIPQKYRFDSMADEESESSESEEDENNTQSKKKRISKRDRKLLKKGVDPSSVPPTPHTKKPVQSQPEQLKQVSTAASRRQKSKLKKIKQKYADQDDDEREARMLILGSAGAKPKEVKVEEPTSKAANASKLPKQTTPAAKPKPHQKQVAQTDEQALRLKQQQEEAMQNLALEAMSDQSILNELTGRPEDDDVLLCAIPMCGPYSALKKFKFKVRLTPGNTKTGGAVKTSLNIFKHLPDITDQQKDLLSSLSESEAMLQMMGGVNVSAPGMAKLSQQKRNLKKKKQTSNK